MGSWAACWRFACWPCSDNLSRDMSTDSHHRIHRHPAAPWAELRVSVNTLACYRPHAHAEYSIGLVEQGQAVFHHPAGPTAVSPGSVVMIEPEVVHSCNPLRQQAWSYRMLFIDADWLHAALARHWGLPAPLTGLAFLSPCVDDPVVAGQVKGLCEPLGSDSEACRLAWLLSAWISNWARPGRAHDVENVPHELAPAIDHLQSRPGLKTTVRELAALCKLTEATFIRRFQGVFGMTPGRYLLNLRLNGARTLLSRGMPLAEAAHAMGFADQAHLQRCFKAHHAMTPGNYRHRP